MKPGLASIISILLILTSCTRDENNLKMVAVKDLNTIWIMNVDGSDRKALTTFAEDGDCKDPSWSADCEKIVYISFSNPDFRLCIMNPDGSGKQILYTVTNTLYDPSFSPDGSRIIFGCIDNNLYEYSFSTGNVTSINSILSPLQSLSISSEGRICFIDIGNAYFYTPGTGWGSTGVAGSVGATYSPDGKKIVYYYDFELYITASDGAAFDGVGYQVAIGNTVSSFQNAWDPAGDYIYFETASGISRIRPVAGSVPEVVVNDSTFKYPQIQGKSK